MACTAIAASSGSNSRRMNVGQRTTKASASSPAHRRTSNLARTPRTAGEATDAVPHRSPGWVRPPAAGWAPYGRCGWICGRAVRLRQHAVRARTAGTPRSSTPPAGWGCRSAPTRRSSWPSGSTRSRRARPRPSTAVTSTRRCGRRAGEHLYAIGDERWPGLGAVIDAAMHDPAQWLPFRDTARGARRAARGRHRRRRGVQHRLGRPWRRSSTTGSTASSTASRCRARSASAKPDRAIFALACARLGVEPAAVLMVGDDAGADAGAAALGMAHAAAAGRRRPAGTTGWRCVARPDRRRVRAAPAGPAVSCNPVVSSTGNGGPRQCRSTSS